MSPTPISTGLTAQGRAVDLGADPRIGVLVTALRQASAVTDPTQMLRAFGPWVAQRFPRDGFISVSVRDLPPGKYKITRAIPSTRGRPIDGPGSTGDPWRDWLRLPTYEGGLIGRIIAGGEPQIITGVDFTLDPVLSEVLGEDASSVRTISAMPAYDGGEALNWSMSFHERMVWNNLDTFAAGLLDVNLMGTATRNLVFRRQAESLNDQLVGQFEQIAKIQRQLLPERAPKVGGYALATSYLPSDIAGGDYYDFFRISDGRLGIVIADVSGHGAGAATVMAMLRAILHCYRDMAPGSAETTPETARVARYCNQKLVEANLNGEFATAFFCVLDPPTGRLEWTRCGHNPPLIRRREGAIEEIESAGTLPLGITADIDFESDSCALYTGDTLLLYTDGITEAATRRSRGRRAHELGQGQEPGQDGRRKMFGVSRLTRALASCTGEPGCAIDSVHGALLGFTGRMDRDDDQTLVVVQRKEDPS